MSTKNERKMVHFEDESLRSSEDSDKKFSEDGLSVQLDELEPRAEHEAHGLLHEEEKEHDDLEAQKSRPASLQESVPVEYTVSTSKKLAFLGLYFVLNLSLTLSNKALLNHASYPWMLTFAHTTATSIGCLMLSACGHVRLTKLSWRDSMVLVAFSVLFTLNIAISNVSLSAVSVPFHQIMRSTAPVITIFIYRVVYNRTYSMPTYISLIPIIVGVVMATFGDYYFTFVGFFLTLLGVLLASVKTVTTNRLMTGTLKLSAMELLLRMSPLAAVQCLVGGALSGELSQLYMSATGVIDQRSGLPLLLILGILGNACMAFALNLVSFQTNKVAGALTISVCANVKQVLTIALGILIFHLNVAIVNGIGMVIAICGAAFYSKVELDRKKATTPR